MKTITKTYTVYSFSELEKEAQEKAINEHILFLIEIEDFDKPTFISHAIKVAAKFKTPWFLAQIVYDQFKDRVIESIKINNYKFLENGEFFHN